MYFCTPIKNDKKDKTNTDMSVTILGIESSCDDTSAAVIRDEVMLSNVIASQAVHEAYGGVVPELLRGLISKISYRWFPKP